MHRPYRCNTDCHLQLLSSVVVVLLRTKLLTQFKKLATIGGVTFIRELTLLLRMAFPKICSRNFQFLGDGKPIRACTTAAIFRGIRVIPEQTRELRARVPRMACVHQHLHVYVDGKTKNRIMLGTFFLCNRCFAPCRPGVRPR